MIGRITSDKNYLIAFFIVYNPPKRYDEFGQIYPRKINCN